MPFKSIEYTELVSTGEYEHRRIGMTYELETGDTPESAVQMVREKVKEAHTESGLKDDYVEVLNGNFHLFTRRRLLTLVNRFGPTRGVCSECGCTLMNPCREYNRESGHEESCSWVDEGETLCSSCHKRLEAEKNQANEAHDAMEDTTSS